MAFGKGGEGGIKNVGDFSSPFDISKQGNMGGSDSIMGMRGGDTDNVVQVKVPPSTGGGGGIQNTGTLDPGKKPIK